MWKMQLMRHNDGMRTWSTTFVAPHYDFMYDGITPLQVVVVHISVRRQSHRKRREVTALAASANLDEAIRVHTIRPAVDPPWLVTGRLAYLRLLLGWLTPWLALALW